VSESATKPDALDAITGILRRVARDHDVITYSDLSDELRGLGYPEMHYRPGSPLYMYLDKVNLRERAQDRGALSAVAVNKAGGKPGKHFYDQMGKEPFSRTGDPEATWAAERDRVWAEARG
jgi:hypothetical protein